MRRREIMEVVELLIMLTTYNLGVIIFAAI